MKNINSPPNVQPSEERKKERGGGALRRIPHCDPGKHAAEPWCFGPQKETISRSPRKKGNQVAPPLVNAISKKLKLYSLIPLAA